MLGTNTTPLAPLVRNADYYTPDCDALSTFPLPSPGAIEGASGYTCVGGGDCHMLVIDPVRMIDWEIYHASVTSGKVYADCAIQWDMTKVYPATLRGDQCTSTDAAGFPVAPMLISADEVATGTISHAIRLILPNSSMASGIYVRPATHAGGPPGPQNSAVPYGALFRLRANYPIANLPSKGAQVIARAMQKYGMYLADGGNIALTAINDQFTTAKWADLINGSQDLRAIKVTDLDIIQHGTPIPLTYDCVRTNGNS